MTYTITIIPAALRHLATLPRSVQERIRDRIDRLAMEPRPSGIRKLAGVEALYRIRVGDYRIVYQIEDDRLTILIVRIAHRREVYRGL